MGNEEYFDDSWNPSWDKGAIDTDVIDKLIEVRIALYEIVSNGFYPNHEQSKKIMVELKWLKSMI
ncbi:MAG: hypothetical protein QHH15_00015 [Candidatus Thermoplasmatota archaeon]|nr:hypothetical protein [Candidatus Thermoplasmatota archaeon]